jgi:hypothetical protein
MMFSLSAEVTKNCVMSCGAPGDMVVAKYKGSRRHDVSALSHAWVTALISECLQITLQGEMSTKHPSAAEIFKVFTLLDVGC